MDIPVWQQRQVPWRFSPVEMPQILFIENVADTPVWQQRQISQRAQFMIPQVRSFDKVDMPFAVRDQSRQHRTPLRFHMFSFLFEWMTCRRFRYRPL